MLHGNPIIRLTNEGLENVFLIQAAKSKNKKLLCKSNIKIPACVDFIQRTYDDASHCDKPQARHKTNSTCKTLLEFLSNK